MTLFRATADSTLTVDAGKESNTQIGLLLEAVASGRVQEQDGSSAIGAVVSVSYEQSMPGRDILAGLVRGDVEANADGVFKISGLMPDTPIALRAELDGRLSDVVTISAITPGFEQTGIVLRMQ